MVVMPAKVGCVLITPGSPLVGNNPNPFEGPSPITFDVT